MLVCRSKTRHSSNKASVQRSIFVLKPGGLNNKVNSHPNPVQTAFLVQNCVPTVKTRERVSSSRMNAKSRNCNLVLRELSNKEKGTQLSSKSYANSRHGAGL